MDNAGFVFTGHACRSCLGRVLRCDETFRCSICEAESHGSPDAICGCGLRPTGIARQGGFRCAPNPARGPASPAAVVILFGDDAPAVAA